MSAKILVRVQNYTKFLSWLNTNSWTLTLHFWDQKQWLVSFQLTWRKCWLIHSVICWMHPLNDCQGLYSCGASQCQHRDTDASGWIYNWYVNAAVWSLVYMKMHTVSVQDPLQDKSSVFLWEQPSSELLCFCTPPLLWLYHQRLNGENWGRRLCFVNNALIIICTGT